MSLYPHQLHFISTNVSIAQSEMADFVRPVTGVCNINSCSYQEIEIRISTGDYLALSHRRFTDYYNYCSGGDHPFCDSVNFDEYPITPILSYPSIPMALGVGGDVALAAYIERNSGTEIYDLYLSVVDN